MLLRNKIFYGIRALSPLCLVGISIANIVLCIVFFLRDTQKRVDLDKEAFDRITNILVLVSRSCSNQISSVRRRLSSEITLASGRFVLTSGVASASSSNPSFSLTAPSPLQTISLPFQKFECNGKPGISLNGYIFGIGDNFGYGDIQEIFSEVVRTSDFIIRRSSSLSRFASFDSPSPEPHKLPLAREVFPP